MKKNSTPLFLLIIAGFLWQIVSWLEMVDAFVLPPPSAVLNAFAADRALLFYHSRYTITNALSGLALGTIFGVITAVSMERFKFLEKSLYPILILSQTIPYIAIAPLLVLWFGHGAAPKIILVTLLCFFPIAVGLFDGLKSIPKEYLYELEILGGSYLRGLVFAKLPLAAPGFFSGKKIALTYCFVGAVISEWIGGVNGLGVYMTRVRRSFEFDKMFAAIFLIVAISLIAMEILKFIERRCLKNVI